MTHNGSAMVALRENPLGFSDLAAKLIKRREISARKFRRNEL
jgi:hypothetical protein